MNHKSNSTRPLEKWESRLGKLSQCQAGMLLALIAVSVLVLSLFLVKIGTSRRSLPEEAPHLRINEVSLSEGWVELYNPTAEAISLDSWTLSDKKTDLYRYVFPADAVVESGGYLLIGCNNTTQKTAITADLTLKRNDILCLSENGAVRDSLLLDTATPEGCSYGYTAEGTLSLLSATPNGENTPESVRNSVEKPVFSQISGFYDEDFTLTITAGAGETIHYTLDGSTPTADSPLYEKPLTITDATENPNRYSMNEFLGTLIKAPLKNQKKVYKSYYSSYLLPEEKVDKCTILRAVAVNEQGVASEIATASYFVGYGDREGYQNIPILSLTSDPAGLYDMDSGIMVVGNPYLNALDKKQVTTATKWYRMRDILNFFQKGDAWERAVHMDWFTADGELALSQDCGLKLHGNTSRRATQKSFSLTADAQYDGNNRLLYDFFGNGLTTDKVVLNAALSPRRYILTNQMDTNRRMETQDYQPVQVFLDGEYCGFYILQEAYDSETYLKDHYGVELEDAVLLKGKDGHWKYESGEEGDIEQYYQPLLDYVSTADLSDSEQYAQLCTMMDMESFVDCYATEIYLANQDWYEGQNGYLYYSKKTSKSNSYADGRWHWLLYDLDYSSGSNADTPYTLNSFTAKRLSPSKTLSNDPFFPYLMKNADFCRQFVTTFTDLANGVYDTETMNGILDSLSEEYREMAWVCVQRYPKMDDALTNDSKTHASRFTAYCDELKEFFAKRFDSIMPDMADYFKLNGKLSTVTVEQNDANGGTVKLNTLTVQSGWSGQYYSDYPVTVTAQPAEGYLFDHWEVSPNGTLSDADAPTAEVSFNGSVTVTAVFVHE